MCLNLIYLISAGFFIHIYKANDNMVHFDMLE